MNQPTKISLLIVAAILFHASWWLVPTHISSPYSVPAISLSDLEPTHSEHWVSNNETIEAHSANVAIQEGRPIATWYAGTEEGHADVALFFSSFDGQWTTPTPFVETADTAHKLKRHIRKIGNPAIHVWPDQAIGIYFVTVSVGGWAGSSINYVESTDGGKSWRKPKRLVTSPFLNLSTLVRAQPLALDNGNIQLPVYQEFLGKFSEVLTLNRNQDVLHKQRLTRGRTAIQPALISTGELTAQALLRYSGDAPHRVQSSTTSDAGRHWTAPEKLIIANPDSAVAAINLGNGKMLAALNDTEDGRFRLSLALADTEKPDSWHVIRVIEDEPSDPTSHEFEFSYPSLALEQDGTIHLVYTWNQTRIKHVRFNQAWLAENG